MGVIKKKLNANYTEIYNVCFFDERLDYIDIGIYTQLASLPDNWEISIRRIDKLHGENKHLTAIANSLNKMINYGYINRIKPKTKINENTGKFEMYDYEIYSSPFDNTHFDAKKIPIDLQKIYIKYFLKMPVLSKNRNQSQEKTVPVTSEDNINNFAVLKNVSNVVVEEEKFLNEVNKKIDKFLEDYGYMYEREISIFGSSELELTKCSFAQFLLDMKGRYCEFEEFINLDDGFAFEIFDEYKQVFNLGNNNVNSTYKNIHNPTGFMITEIRKKINKNKGRNK